MGIRLHSRRVVRRTLLGISLGISTVGLGAIAGISSGAALAFPGGASAHSASAGSSAHGLPGAVTARVIVLNLKSTLHLVGPPGHVDYSKGTVSGSLSGTASTRFVSLGTAKGESTFTIYPSTGGSLTGRSLTQGHVVGASLYFSGTSTITGGTGRWAHAHGTGLTFSGVLNRQNYHSTVTTHGNVSV
jgi:hypothetical protein